MRLPPDLRHEYDVLTDKLLDGQITRRERKRLKAVEREMDAIMETWPSVIAGRAAMDETLSSLTTLRRKIEARLDERQREATTEART